MSALAIKCIPNEAHTKRVLRARVALRIVPPSEGVWAASVGRNAKRQDNEDWLGPKDEHAVPPTAGDAQPSNEGPSQ